MEIHISGSANGSGAPVIGEELGAGDVRKGPWTDEEDELLINYVRAHGEGRWNSVAHFAGLKRTGKSCRLRWLNYLRPDVRRGNITLQEQLMILDLHSRWGNRWSKIAKYLPGRTDNEIKNYWRTRVQKQAKQLKCDVNSQQFRDAMRYEWIPRMMERIRASSGATLGQHPSPMDSMNHWTNIQVLQSGNHMRSQSHDPTVMPEMSSMTSDSSDFQHSPVSDFSEYYYKPPSNVHTQTQQGPTANDVNGCSGLTNVVDQFDMDINHTFEESNSLWLLGGGDQSLLSDDFWNEENIGFLQQQLSDEDICSF
ncbi:transcription factor MYB108-like isoform X2 [Punica granatum]|uniref:Transcription factor MYB108-like isoform X2 n=1 Tax=Punica granatum TaxID=22663 RepID=A0A218X538_PUNGR|nr:transcription factor MYB108-like isoform X2 [Punica granatum]OWM80033.1 hypothetical protein CDL15_Pgr010011 [Punica granatum]